MKLTAEGYLNDLPFLFNRLCIKSDTLKRPSEIFSGVYVVILILVSDYTR
jgi:hypothetical protein